jgi:CMP-N,N'-diacetyllegionaminic acid synthase
MEYTNLRCIAFVPARSKSTRIVDKNVKMLVGHPLMGYAISSALNSEVFSEVIVSTDSEEYAMIAEEYGAKVPFLRPAEFAAELSTDLEWLKYTIIKLIEEGYNFNCFAILRPTNPFRTRETIVRAWKTFINSGEIDSLRAVELCSEHPGKMWGIRGGLLMPILPYASNGIPWHNCPYQILPKVYIQNASLEIAYNRTVVEEDSISGYRIAPFITNKFEGFDINNPEDFLFAEYLVKNGMAALPSCIKLKNGD